MGNERTELMLRLANALEAAIPQIVEDIHKDDHGSLLSSDDAVWPFSAYTEYDQYREER